MIHTIRCGCPAPSFYKIIYDKIIFPISGFQRVNFPIILPENHSAYSPVREFKQKIAKTAKGKLKNFGKIIKGKIIFQHLEFGGATSPLFCLKIILPIPRFGSSNRRLSAQSAVKHSIQMNLI